ncbi:hypothetical protein AC1031_001522 [Aphanomyces cochlioides]|nr:hypothetical protein AC1031_001522 [Aphanomyces cochlioides]
MDYRGYVISDVCSECKSSIASEDDLAIIKKESPSLFSEIRHTLAINKAQPGNRLLLDGVPHSAEHAFLHTPHPSTRSTIDLSHKSAEWEVPSKDTHLSEHIAQNASAVAPDQLVSTTVESSLHSLASTEEQAKTKTDISSATVLGSTNTTTREEIILHLTFLEQDGSATTLLAIEDDVAKSNQR